MANSRKYLNKLKKSKETDFGIYLPYVESIVFEIEGLTNRTEIEMLKLTLKKYSQFLLFIALILSMIIMPSFLITLANQTPNVHSFEFTIYYGWILLGLYSGFIYLRSLKWKRKNINAEIGSMKNAAFIAVNYAHNTTEAYFNDKEEYIKSNNFKIEKNQIAEIDSAMSRCEIDLTMFDRFAYSNDKYRNLRPSDKRRDPSAKRKSEHFLKDYLNHIQKPFKPGNSIFNSIKNGSTE